MLIKFDNFDLVCFFNGLIFYAPVALLIRTRAGVSDSTFFVLQAILSLAIFLGEIPTGFITDKLGYKKSIIISQIMMLVARVLLMFAFLSESLLLFIIEAIVEGFGNCFSSGTNEAYLYSVYGEENFTKEIAHSSNFGTAGFIISTIAYVFIYKFWGINGLLMATIFSGSGAVVFSFFIIKENKIDVAPEKVEVRRVLSFFKEPQSLIYLVLLSILSVIWILINFFYVEKLEMIGISAEWMSAIILVYSMNQMLAEPIISWIQIFDVKKVFFIACSIAGILIISLGIVNHIVISLLIMCIIPLFVTLAEYLLMEQENKMIDERGLEQNRAASLSALNMGVNIVEIVALFISSIFSLNAIRWCFVMVGVVLFTFNLIKLYKIE